MADTKSFTLGMWVDYCIEYNNLLTEEPEETVREATQADIDRFANS